MPVKITNPQPSGPLYRLRDLVTRETVSDLSVVLFPRGAGAPTMARTTPSGIYVARGMRSLAAWELRDVLPDGTTAAADVTVSEHRIEARDPAGRSLSFTVTVDLPAEGLLTSSCGSPVQQRR